MSYQEVPDSQQPTLDLLQKLGWQYLSPEQALAQREGLTSFVLLEGILSSQLHQINEYQYKGKTHKFSAKHINKAIKHLKDLDENGLVPTNQAIYNEITYPKSFTVNMDGDRKSFDLQYINWKEPHKNVFHITEEFEVKRLHRTRRPDVVLFVNGIPLVVIENKRRDKAESAEAAINQQWSYQTKEEGIPQLYHYAQLLLAVQPNKVLYGTVRTPRKFWSQWREDVETDTQRIIQATLNGVVGEDRLPTEQDRVLYAMLQPERLLDLIFRFIIFDGGIKKVARYQQYFAVQETLKRVKKMTSDKGREGGVIWHTQGSGKSITMILLSKALTLDPEISQSRTIVVTDRKSLDKQIKRNFKNCGEEPKKARSGKELGYLICETNTAVITTIVDKFDSAFRHNPNFCNPDKNLFVLIDESHRSQYGNNHAKMRKMMPNACYIGFTGTPLMKKEKKRTNAIYSNRKQSTIDKFGAIIHQYTIEQAVEDGAILPLLYEGRAAILEQNKKQLDRKIERVLKDATKEEIIAYKRRYTTEDQILRSQQVIEEIAQDISDHFEKNWKGKGFKAQIAAPDKLSAIRYHQFFKQEGKIDTRVVISPPDQREAEGDTEDEALKVIQDFWKKEVIPEGGSEKYEREVIETFTDSEESIEIIIVVSKLLTGFDAPRNTVLYLCKKLVEHNLLQAIARVNRLYEGKQYGYIIDYRGILGNLDEAITSYQALAEFDEADLKGTVTNISGEVDKLPQRYSELLDCFKGVEVENTYKRDKEAMERHLAPKDLRDKFYDAYRNFGNNLQLALSSEYFQEQYEEKTIRHYLRELSFFKKFKDSIKNRYNEILSLKKYDSQVRKILDTYVYADGVKSTTKQIEVLNVAERDEALNYASPKTLASKADTIAFKRKKEISERMEEDPVLFKKFSTLIQEAIDAFQEKRISEEEYFSTISQIDRDIENRTTVNLPVSIINKPQATAFYRLIKEYWTTPTDNFSAELALHVSAIIRKLAIRDWKNNADIQNKMTNEIEDYLFDTSEEKGLHLPSKTLDILLEQMMNTARSYEW